MASLVAEILRKKEKMEMAIPVSTSRLCYTDCEDLFVHISLLFLNGLATDKFRLKIKFCKHSCAHCIAETSVRPRYQ